MKQFFNLLFFALLFALCFFNCKKEVTTLQPIAEFTISTGSAKIDEVISFTNQSTNATSYSWDFGDGNSSSQKDPTHSYRSAGIFSVKLSATGEGGTDVKSKSITIAVPPAVAAFSISKTSAEVGESIAFTNTSMYAKKYSWDFGDNSTSFEENPSHIYSEAGNYTVQLKATGEGGSNTVSESIKIEIARPKAAFTIDRTNAKVGENISFINQSEDATSYSWEFGDGNTSSEESPTHSYSSAKVYTVTLTATGEGGSDAVSKSINVVDEPPVAAFSMDKNTVAVGEVISFTNQSQRANSYTWNFGDGNFSLQKDPSHSYSVAGTYTIKLTAVGGGGINTTSKVLKVTEEEEEEEQAVDPAFTGKWIIVEGFYDGTKINNLSGSFELGDEGEYSASFTDGTNRGSATARYTISADGILASNLTGQNLILNGIASQSTCCPTDFLWVTNIHCNRTIFLQWGETAIGSGDPAIVVVNDQLVLTSADGKAVLRYELE